MNTAPTLSPIEKKAPVNVACEPCGHVWTAAWTPMLMSKMAKLMGSLHCPNCSNGPKKIFLAKSPGFPIPSYAEVPE